MSASRQFFVRVDGENVTIWVAKTGKVTWKAWGDFRGERIDATGQSETGAISAWQDTAAYASKK